MQQEQANPSVQEAARSKCWLMPATQRTNSAGVFSLIMTSTTWPWGGGWRAVGKGTQRSAPQRTAAQHTTAHLPCRGRDCCVLLLGVDAFVQVHRNRKYPLRAIAGAVEAAAVGAAPLRHQLCGQGGAWVPHDDHLPPLRHGSKRLLFSKSEWEEWRGELCESV